MVELRSFYGNVSQANVGQLKKLHEATLPVNYSDKFYADVHKHHSRLLYHSDVVIGAVCCREEKIPDSGSHKLYIMTLAVLEPYRRHHIGSRMLEDTVKAARASGKVSCLYLHVQSSNTAAMAFYLRHGFVISETLPDYYKRIVPSEAHILQLQL